MSASSSLPPPFFVYLCTVCVCGCLAVGLNNDGYGASVPCNGCCCRRRIGVAHCVHIWQMTFSIHRDVSPQAGSWRRAWKQRPPGRGVRLRSKGLGGRTSAWPHPTAACALLLQRCYGLWPACAVSVTAAYFACDVH